MVIGGTHKTICKIKLVRAHPMIAPVVNAMMLIGVMGCVRKYLILCVMFIAV